MSARLTRYFLTTSFFALLMVCVSLPTLAQAQTLPTGVIAQQHCGTASVDIRSYGAGLMMQFEAPEIQNPRVAVRDAAADCVAISWETNMPAAVQIIYAEAAAEPVSIDLDAEYFGYPHATPQNNSGEAMHTAILEGLEAGTTYTYRIVTRAHPTAPPRIGDVRTVTIAPSAPSPVPTTTPVAPPPSQSVPSHDSSETATQSAETPSRVPEIASETTATTTPADSDATTTTTNAVPSALNAARAGLGAALPEREALTGLLSGFRAFVVEPQNFAELTPLRFFAHDDVIAPVLLFIVVLLLIQHTVQPLTGITIENKALYWLSGSGIFVILAAASGYYYLTFVAIALFLAFLAWYLIRGVPDASPTQRIPFIESTGKTADANSRKKEQTTAQ